MRIGQVGHFYSAVYRNDPVSSTSMPNFYILKWPGFLYYTGVDQRVDVAKYVKESAQKGKKVLFFEICNHRLSQMLVEHEFNCEFTDEF